MRTSLFYFFLASAMLTTFAIQPAAADDSTTASGQAGSSGTPANSGTDGGARAQRIERIKEAFAQLDLTDAQKDQIKQIRASVTDRRERFVQILNVLTPDQKAKLRELRRQYHSGSQSGADDSLSPGAN